MLLTTNRLRLRIDCSARCVILFSVVFFRLRVRST